MSQQQLEQQWGMAVPGTSPLHVALKEGSLEQVRMLVEAGHSVKVSCWPGLHWQRRAGSAAQVALTSACLQEKRARCHWGGAGVAGRMLPYLDQ